MLREKLVLRVRLTFLRLLFLQDLQVLVDLLALNFKFCLISPMRLFKVHLASPPLTCAKNQQMTQGDNVGLISVSSPSV